MKRIQTLLLPLSIIVLAAGMRLLPHIPNVAPITAMALFGGVYLNKKYALVVPLLAMLASDIFLGFSAASPFVYGSFLLIGLIGLSLREHKRVKMVMLASLVSSLLFFVITNVGVWLVGGLYPKTTSGLVGCFGMAIPFFRNTILGDLFYSGAMFGGYELVMQMMKNNILSSLRTK